MCCYRRCRDSNDAGSASSRRRDPRRGRGRGRRPFCERRGRQPFCERRGRHPGCEQCKRCTAVLRPRRLTSLGGACGSAEGPRRVGAPDCPRGIPLALSLLGAPGGRPARPHQACRGRQATVPLRDDLGPLHYKLTGDASLVRHPTDLFDERCSLIPPGRTRGLASLAGLLPPGSALLCSSHWCARHYDRLVKSWEASSRHGDG